MRLRLFSIRKIGLFTLPFFLACAAPRSINHSPETVPKGHWRFSGQGIGILPTQTSEALYGGLEGGVRSLWNELSRNDTAHVAITADSLNRFAKALIAYSIDPLGMQTSLGIHYGIWTRLELGYAYTSGVHTFETGYQWLGKPGTENGEWKGNLALRYSSQEYDMPSLFYLDKLQSILKYKFERRDVLVPLTLGKNWGANGRYGSFACGVAYDWAHIQYGSDLTRLVETISPGITKPFSKLAGDRIIHAFGGFANARVGYSRVFLVPAFTLFWQDYGTYPLFGNKSTHLSGLTFIPALGLEVRL